MLGSMPRVSGSMSAKRIRAPCLAKARAVVVNVKDGTMTESPGPMSSIIADSSSAEVHDVVSNVSAAPVASVRISAARLEKGPPEEVWPLSIDCLMYENSSPSRAGSLNGMR